MWILESRGDFFQGRRMWLKPGKQYLFGRVKKDGVRFALDHKTVSRKHLVISVDDVKESDVSNAYARTKITITDQGSKTGTSVNGEKIKESRSLSRATNVIKLGTCQEELMVKWEPVTLTFNLLKKELKAGLLRSKQERIRELDIRVISDFIPGTSTLLVVNKRNTAKGLQALINGKHLVTESYVDALEYAATPTDLEEEENLCPLELDFDKAWPDPVEYLPPQGKEPTSRTDSAYMPDQARQNIFQDFTFVFADQTQFDNLLPPITTGHGKALLFPIREGETTSEELVAYMRQAAGSKSFGDERKEADAGAVILVRWISKSDAHWTNHLVDEVALDLDQRAIEQSEFLDAILASDASMLRRSVPCESMPVSQQPPASTSESITSNELPNRSRGESHEAVTASGRDSSAPQATVSVPVNPSPAISNSISQPRVEPHNDTIPKSKTEQSSPMPSYRFSPRLKPQIGGFDDDFDEDAIIPFEDDDEEEEPSTASRATRANGYKESTSKISRSGSDSEYDARDRSAKKRTRSAISIDRKESNSRDLDEFLPTSTAIKRRKIEQNREDKNESPAKPSSGFSIKIPVSRSNNTKEINVKEELRAQRERSKQWQATEAMDDEDEQPVIEYDDQGKVRVYEVETEYIDVPLPKTIVEKSAENGSTDWDPRWNGRKNFKAFRRAKDPVSETLGDRRRAHTRVIVPLVDGKLVTYGIGDQYWERSEAEQERDRSRKKKASQRNPSTQHGSLNQAASKLSDANESADNSDEEVPQTSNNEASFFQASPAVTRLQQEATEILDDEIDVDQPRRTRADETRSQIYTQSPTESARGTKRPGSSGRPPTTKKQKILPITNVSGAGDDSDDGSNLKFKFGRSRRGRGRGRA